MVVLLVLIEKLTSETKNNLKTSRLLLVDAVPYALKEATSEPKNFFCITFKDGPKITFDGGSIGSLKIFMGDLNTLPTQVQDICVQLCVHVSILRSIFETRG